MSYINGPKIVTDGLVLCLDAGNPKSYGGSGNDWINLANISLTTGSLVNNPNFSSIAGGVIDFDGTNDYVSLGSFTDMGITDRTYFFWFKYDVIGTFSRVITFPADDGTTDTPTFTFAARTTGLSFGIGGAPFNGYVGNSVILSANTWYCAAASIISKTVTGYLNGSLLGSATSTGTVATTPLGYIGRYNNFYSQYLDGQVSSFLYYTRPLSAAEILQNYNATRSRYGV